MNTDKYKQLLLDKQRELQAAIARLRGDALDSGVAEVRDPMDEAVTDQSTSQSLQEDTLASETLLEVQDALGRIETGTYGKCLDCGRQIEANRLEAVPWARYCLEDQRKHDRAAQAEQGGSTL